LSCAAWCKLLGLVMALGLLCSPAAGLIISTDLSMSNTEQDPANLPAYDDFPYWGNVGWRGTGDGPGSCIYLGGGWVLTANHVASGYVKLGDATYDWIPGTNHQIDGADLKVFQISNPPLLPTIPIAETVPSVGTAVLMLGTGRDQQAQRTYWDVKSGVWTEVSQSPPTWEATGFEWSDSRVKRWGSNTVSKINQQVGGTQSLLTRFDRTGTDYEAQAAVQDSGAPCFVKDDGIWKLAGMIYNVSNYRLGQPTYSSVDEYSPFGGNDTVLADLAYYRDGILAATPAILGDLNWDGLVNAQDINPFVLAFTDPDAYAEAYPGRGILEVGDINGDDLFNAQDINPFVVLLTGGGLAGDPVMVPEPTTLLLLGGGALVIALRRRRR